MSRQVFIISPPRSGSSMMQQMLLTNPRISSEPEPWFLLLLSQVTELYGEISYSGFNTYAALENANRFFSRLPCGKEIVEDNMKSLANQLYKEALAADASSDIFLDKTPRYYHIIERIIDWFPDSKIIMLVRSPLAVFCSINEYNFKGNLQWLEREDRRHDIFTSFAQIAKYKNHSNVHFVRYEDFILDSVSRMNEIIHFLGLTKAEFNLENGYELSSKFSRSKAVDLKSVSNHNLPVNNYLDSWKLSVKSAQLKRVLQEYLDKLDANVIDSLGYSIQAMKRDLENISVKKKLVTKSFDDLTNNYGRGIGLKKQLFYKLFI